MGCGASKITPQNGEDAKSLHANGNKIEHDGQANGSITAAKSNGSGELKNNQNSAQLNGNINVKPQGHVDVANSISNREVFDDEQGVKESQQTPTHGANQTSQPQSPVAKPVAFDIVLGHSDSEKPSPLMPNRPPRRLKKIESAPTLTREALEQKQTAADQNRQKELEKKVKVVSRRRSELLIAREMDKAQQQKAELEGKLSASDRKREKAQAEIIAKQRRREEKAKRVRNKAKQIQDGDDVVDFAVDRDETYNADEDESWDDDAPMSPSAGSLDENNDGRLGDREQVASQNKDPTTDEQEQVNNVHDFFDS